MDEKKKPELNNNKKNPLIFFLILSVVATIILNIPSRILGAICGLIQNFVIVFITFVKIPNNLMDF